MFSHNSLVSNVHRQLNRKPLKRNNYSTTQRIPLVFLMTLSPLVFLQRLVEDLTPGSTFLLEIPSLFFFSSSVGSTLSYLFRFFSSFFLFISHYLPFILLSQNMAFLNHIKNFKYTSKIKCIYFFH